MANLIGVANFATGPKNNINDYSVNARAIYTNEGVIDGLVITPTSPASSAINISAGRCVIDCGNDGFLVFELLTDALNVPVPNTGSPKHYLVAIKTNITNPTVSAETVILEGSVGTDPNIVEGSGNPKEYYIVIGRLTPSGATIGAGDILQDAITLTNNTTPEIIYRSLDFMLPKDTGWRLDTNTWNYVSSTQIKTAGDVSDSYRVGMKLSYKNTARKYAYITAISYSAGETTLTLNSGSEYSVANTTIGDVYTSTHAQPVGFPDGFAYSVALTTSGSAPSLGNGTLTGKFWIDGKTLRYRIVLLLGTTTSLGTGTLRFSIPLQASDAEGTDIFYGGSATCVNSGVGTYCAMGLIESDQSYIVLQTTNDNNVVTATAPFSFGSGDSITITGHYLTDL